MFCTNCGENNEDNAEFCVKCGSKLKDVTVKKSGTPSLGSLTSGELKVGNISIDKSKMNLAGIICGAIALISAFLPYISAEIWGMKSSTSLIQGGDGVIVIIFALGAIVCAVIDKKIPLTVMGVLLLAIIGLESKSLTEGVEELSYYGIDFDDIFKMEIGFYLLLLSSIGVTVSGCYTYVLKLIKKN